ncbi:leucine-rich repeat receptor protein kinase HPCA1-like [Magnolia sinica]|uniref:leucine-rich repeat receptor protein kinase HPCA1-like n=1 Tax=Magnolia sinica TaxID=86752 RepID=UPI00265AD4D9|nr:leucine-rich repeat receptor protein kinase HPCA1-like [Magnolia sinica]
MVTMPLRWLLLLLVATEGLYRVSSSTDGRDAAALGALRNAWKNTPPSWDKSNDPCDSMWEGVNCTNGRVIELKLASMGIVGTLDGDIGELTELNSLDLSFNPGLSGSVSRSIGELKKLKILILTGCSFTGNIPEEIGNLPNLTFLALNLNRLTNEIPPSFGKLSNIYVLDLSENQLTGSLPVSNLTTPGLDQLLQAGHFHFNKNRLSGKIPDKLFSSEMKLIHILFDGNQLTGEIPSTLGLVQTLEVLRLDRNSLNGSIPDNLNNLTKIYDLHLSNNHLTGPVPNLTGMTSLNFVDLSNNSFDASEAPTWFSTAQSLTTLAMEHGALQGPVPQKLFSFPQLQQVKLKNNSFNGTFDMGESISPKLQLVDLENNQIAQFPVHPSYKKTLVLVGNPLCTAPQPSNDKYCQHQQSSRTNYSTNLANCSSTSCPPDQRPRPQTCYCAVPYTGTLNFRAPLFRVLPNSTTFQSLEMCMWKELGLTPGSVSLQNPFINMNDDLQVHLELFPSTGYFNRSEIQRLTFGLSCQGFTLPKEFGPYSFVPNQYPFPDGSGGTSKSSNIVIGIAVGCAVLVLVLVGVVIYIFRQKKRATRDIELSRPVSWGLSGEDRGGAPQLKGARWFSYDELKKGTNNFSESNEIGSGGYGKVYRAKLLDGQIVAIKRAQQGSMQGTHEFKTEIELLSRVHHKNLVSLVGFCFENGEQMLIYEYVPNGTLRESLSEKSGIHLNWKRRLRIALGSARGLAYLHELADPPTIHRDIKSTNILLDENLTAKVADFGLSRLVSDNRKKHVSTQVKGTMGYLDPEYYMTQQLTDKSDVYSFGVVMLELISAKKPIEKGKYIVREVRMAMDKNEEHYGLSEIMDPSIRYATNLIGFGRFVELAMQCLEESPEDRPKMSEVVREIETILQNDGLNTHSTSASSSATDFEPMKGSLPHPYNETLPEKDENNDAFDYSGGYTSSAKLEPK